MNSLNSNILVKPASSCILDYPMPCAFSKAKKKMSNGADLNCYLSIHMQHEPHEPNSRVCLNRSLKRKIYLRS